MDNTEFEAKMRCGERFHGARLPPGDWVVLRVDGHGFSRLTESHFQKPFDERFHQSMVHTAQALLEEFDGLYVYTESDEISLLLPRAWSMFNRSHEKMISLSAGIASSVFTQATGIAAHFDSRVWLGSDDATVVDYFRWRQSDASRCALNGWCYWTLRQQGQNYSKATRTLERQSMEFKRDLLLQNGIVFDEVPMWQRAGVGVYWETYTKQGYNPVLAQAVTAARRRIVTNLELSGGNEYAKFILKLIVDGALTIS